jgi:demethylmenaquinone methyltransferase / 2-methoxy-6-polyprenyl-1,4-benzoquinol methylase
VSSKYYVEGGQRAGRVVDLFAAVAPRYDLINDLQSLGMHRLWKRRMVKAAAVGPGMDVLDVCCGTGDVAFALAQSGAKVTGLDFSEAMLSVARRRGVAAGVEFIQGDALALPFPAARFDAVTVAYGVRNMADVDRGLDELLRVLKPGGRLVILEFGKPENGAIRWLYFQYLRWLVPVFGKLFYGDSDTHGYILESLLKYPGQRGIDALLRARGCRDPRVLDLMFGAMSLNVAVKAR